MTGLVFGRLTVTKFSHICPKKRNAMWECICECGNNVQALGTYLRAGFTKSCGCLHKDVMTNRVPYNLINMTGEVFGKLTVINQTEGKRRCCWDCLCECGTIKSVERANLISGRQVSCGCLNREKAKDRYTTHGHSKTSLYKVWSYMITRCYNENVDHYYNYGGRGISVCERWRTDFMNFYDDMHIGYIKGLHLDRIEVNGNYEPGNCRWVTAKENARNKRNNLRLNVEGVIKTLKEWAEIHDQSYLVMRDRFHRETENINYVLFGNRSKVSKEIMLKGIKKENK